MGDLPALLSQLSELVSTTGIFVHVVDENGSLRLVREAEADASSAEEKSDTVVVDVVPGHARSILCAALSESTTQSVATLADDPRCTFDLQRLR
jgi:hypothetical protein